MKSVILTDEGFDFLKLYEDGSVENTRTNHKYNQELQHGTLVVWNKGRSVSVQIQRLWRKYFKNEIEQVPDEDKRSLEPLMLSHYTITRDGRVWNHVQYKWGTPYVSKSTGYVKIMLTNDSGCTCEYKIHRLLLMAFKPNPRMDYLEVDHIDGNKENNSLDNLEWVSSYENHWRARDTCLRDRTLTDDDVHKFCKEWSTGKYKTAGQCARAVGLCVTACEHIIRHGTHRDISSLYGIEYKKPVRLTPVDWSRYPKSKYLKRPTAEKSVACTPSNCEDRLRAPQPQS